MTIRFNVYTAPKVTMKERIKYWFMRRRLYQWFIWRKYSRQVGTQEFTVVSDARAFTRGK